MKKPRLTKAVRQYMSYIGSKAKGTKKTLTEEQRQLRRQQMLDAHKFRWPKKKETND